MEQRFVPPDSDCYLRLGFEAPFIPQDRPPLAIAMLTSLRGVRHYRHYRLVLANRQKLRLCTRAGEGFSNSSTIHSGYTWTG